MALEKNILRLAQKQGKSQTETFTDIHSRHPASTNPFCYRYDLKPVPSSLICLFGISAGHPSALAHQKLTFLVECSPSRGAPEAPTHQRAAFNPDCSLRRDHDEPRQPSDSIICLVLQVQRASGPPASALKSQMDATHKKKKKKKSGKKEEDTGVTFAPSCRLRR